MKAVILAGGLGTRLRPITYKIPKPLVPLAGKPMVMHIIDSLPPRVDTVVLAVSYMKDVLEEYFRVNDCGRKVILVNESSPLGTGGAIKNVEAHLDDTFIVFNGDVLTSIDVNALVKFHRSKGGIGTLALWKVDDPSAFGVVAMDHEDRITQFQEKPARNEAASDMINAGVYIFEPDVLDSIGKGVVSLEKETFPKILREGLFGFRYSGYWVDCGTRESYLNAQRTLMDIRATTSDDGTKAAITPPVHLTGANTESSTIGPYVYAEPDVNIHEGAVVSNSALMRGSVVGQGAVVRNSIVGPGFIIENGTEVIDTVVANH